MVPSKLSFLIRSCLITLSAGLPASDALAASTWNVTNGTTLDVTAGYTANTAGDYPLFVSGQGSVLQSAANGLNFRASGDNLYAAKVADGGTLNLKGSSLSTNGKMAHGVDVSSGKLLLDGGSITVAGGFSSAVAGRDGADIYLSHISLGADGNDSAGVTITTGTLTADNLSILATGEASSGLNFAHSTSGTANGKLENVSVMLRGAGTKAGLMLGNGTVTGTGVTLSSTGNNRGVDVYNANGGKGVLVLDKSNITTANGDAVYILNGDVTLNDATINTVNGQGINVNNGSTATLSGGSITTTGNGADAMWIASKTSKATAEGTTFITEGSGAMAVNAQYGPATLKKSTLTTHGAASHGIYTESQVQGSDLQITTSASNAMGIYATKGGVVDLDTVSIATTGNAAAGMLVYPDSTINGSAVTLTTTGISSPALWASEGAINLTDSTLSTTGTSSFGLLVSGSPNGKGSNVTLDHTSLTTASGPAVRVQGTGLKLALKNGTKIESGNGVLLDSMSGDPAAANYNPDVNVTADNQVTLTGDVRSATESHVTLALTNASKLTGATTDITSMALDDSSLWYMTANSTSGTFDNNGVMKFVDSDGVFKTLTLDTLTGHGLFNMNTNIASLEGDLVVVKGLASGNHSLGIQDSGRDPGKTDDALTVVKTGGGEAAFTLNGGVVDVGTYQYELQHRGNDWVLAQKQQNAPEPEPEPAPEPTPDPTPDPTPEPSQDPTPAADPIVEPTPRPDPEPANNPVPTPTAVTALGLFNATPTVWYGELTTLRTRMGEVREGKKEGEAWVQLIGSQYDVSQKAGVSYQQTQSGISVGVDAAHDMEGGQYLTGLFSGYSQSNLDFDSNSTGTINSFFIGSYVTWLFNEGWYIDAVAKANNFSSDADVQMSGGGKTRGGYNTPGFGMSLEAGRHFTLQDGWFAEPSLQVSSLWVKGTSYRYENGLEANSGQATSRQVAAQGVAGKNFTLNNGMMIQPWLRAAVIEEFSDDNTVRINGNKFTNDMSGSRTELGAGLSAQLTHDVQTYVDARYSKGDKIESPWGANAGVRWRW